jgi:hypothetical protein
MAGLRNLFEERKGPIMTWHDSYGSDSAEEMIQRYKALFHKERQAEARLRKAKDTPPVRRARSALRRARAETRLFMAELQAKFGPFTADDAAEPSS